MDLRSHPFKKGCILCGKPLTYGPTRLRVCCLCGLTEPSDCVCPDGHFVCSACHTAELADLLLPVLTQTDERDPLRLLERMMELPAVNLHGPEYHILVPCVLLSAYSRCGGAPAMPLEKALSFAMRRARQLPGGICGSWVSILPGLKVCPLNSAITSGTWLAEVQLGIPSHHTSELTVSPCSSNSLGSNGPACWPFSAM